MRLYVLTALATVFLAGTATAQGANCGQRDFIVERLASKYGETRQSIGLGANNQLMEVFASEDTGSWSILFTNAQGMTCLVASGQSFESLREERVALDPNV